jgi:hypothetical protein
MRHYGMGGFPHVYANEETFVVAQVWNIAAGHAWGKAISYNNNADFLFSVRDHLQSMCQTSTRTAKKSRIGWLGEP